MPKAIPIHSAAGRHTMAGVAEVTFTALDGKEITVAFMPSFGRNICDLIEKLLREPDTTAVEAMPSASRRVLKATAAGEPLRSGGFRVSAAPLDGVFFLQIAQQDGTVAELPFDREWGQKLVDHLQSALQAIQPVKGSA